MSIETLNIEKTFPQDAELTNRLIDLCYEYAGEVSTSSVIGALDIAKMTIWSDNFLDFIEE